MQNKFRELDQNVIDCFLSIVKFIKDTILRSNPWIGRKDFSRFISATEKKFRRSLKK